MLKEPVSPVVGVLPPIEPGTRRFHVTSCQGGNGDPLRQGSWAIDLPAAGTHEHDVARLWYDTTDQSGEAAIVMRVTNASGKSADVCMRFFPSLQVVSEWHSQVPKEAQ